MPGRLGPRFAIETLFLIALAVGAAYADLDAKWIVLIMAGGWLVVALLELTAERMWAAVPPWRRPNYYAAVAVAPPEAVPVEEPAPEPEPEPALEPAPAEVVAVEPEPEAATIVVPAPDATPEPDPAEDPKRPRLEPLEPRPKRRWFRRRAADLVPIEPPAPEPPKHVRLLPPPTPSRADSEVAEVGTEQERGA